VADKPSEQGVNGNYLHAADMNMKNETTRASPRVCQNLLGKSCVLPTYKKLCKVKKNSSPTVWHNSLAKSKSNLHQES
jgi:hypothetical protein